MSKKKAGRPKKSDSERRDTDVRIRMTPNERKVIEAAAKALGFETSTWARAVLLRAARDGASVV